MCLNSSGQISRRGGRRRGWGEKRILHALVARNSRSQVRYVQAVRRNKDNLVYRGLVWGWSHVFLNWPSLWFGHLQFHHNQFTIPVGLVQKIVTRIGRIERRERSVTGNRKVCSSYPAIIAFISRQCNNKCVRIYNYRSMQSILDYDEPDFEEVFSLNFEVNREAFGEQKTFELIPGGSKVPVTLKNK